MQTKAFLLTSGIKVMTTDYKWHDFTKRFCQMNECNQFKYGSMDIMSRPLSPELIPSNIGDRLLFCNANRKQFKFSRSKEIWRTLYHKMPVKSLTFNVIIKVIVKKMKTGQDDRLKNFNISGDPFLISKIKNADYIRSLIVWLYICVYSVPTFVWSVLFFFCVCYWLTIILKLQVQL